MVGGEGRIEKIWEYHYVELLFSEKNELLLSARRLI
jgi:hypothetical protein